MSDDTPKLPAVRIMAVSATCAENDEALVSSWLDSLESPHSRRNFAMSAQRFLAELPVGGLRAATVEDTRDALRRVTRDVSEATGRQYTLRIKSLLTYAHELGYTPFNAGVRIKVRNDASNRGASLAKRIITPAEVALLIRAAPSRRDRILIGVAYAGGLRVSELVGLSWADVLPRENDQVQLSILGKGGKLRQVLLPDIVSRTLLTLRGDAGANDPVFANRRGGHLTERAVHGMVKRAAARAGVNAAISPHWLRHAHGSHAIEKGASLPEVQETLGHANITTTSGYLHARPGSSSGLKLDRGVFFNEDED
jgi:integrase/recombinase XerD